MPVKFTSILIIQKQNKLTNTCRTFFGPIVQQDRILDFQSGDAGFKSPWDYYVWVAHWINVYVYKHESTINEY